MRLSKIRLAGFKSFVDPTTVPFPSNLTGVVGPNGCGKSNVIDAVRWVMGESSARHLRGDTMADVIFNGSASRKPVGHATIELVFDNSSGSVGGQYAQYSEIAIRRVVGRDGQSSYFLNGTRCRRKDITDLFLGTGLGPRSYAVIEQGMISRFIDAKPEELRVFLEEAAGISKYKERRRETENRIRHTRDNLDRLNDLRDELEKQLQRLDRQAKVAERFKRLKQDERRVKAEHLALRWQGAAAQVQAQEERVRQTETGYQQQLAHQRQLEAAIEKHRAQHTEVTEVFNKVQGTYYAVGSDIARLEQSIQHGRDKGRQLQQDLTQIDASVSEANVNLQADDRRLTELEQTLADIEPALQEAKEVEYVSGDARRQAEATMQEWQDGWETFTAEAAEPARVVEVERTHIQHLEQQTTVLTERLARFERERHGLSPGGLELEVVALGENLARLAHEVEREHAELERCQHDIAEQRGENQRLSDVLHEERGTLQSMRGRLSSLDALQEAALGKREGAVIDWLDNRGLKHALRLAQGIEVEAGWERAVETVLGFHLEAVCVDDLDALTETLTGLEHGALGVFEVSRPDAAQPPGMDGATSLLTKVRSNWPLGALLGGVYTAESSAAALAQRRRLAAHESVITPEGIWIGPNWLRVARDADEKSGVLHREHEIKELKYAIAQHEERTVELQRQLDAGKQRLQAVEAERERRQTALREATTRHAQAQADLGARRAALEQVLAQSDRLRLDSGEAALQLEHDQRDLAGARARLEQAVQTVAAHEQKRAELQARRERLQQQLEEARERARSDHDAAHQLALRMESTRTALESTHKARGRIEAQLRQLAESRGRVGQALADSEAPIATMQEELEQVLARRLEVEAELGRVRSRLDDIEHAMDKAAAERHAAEQQAQAVREALEALRMECQGLEVRRQTIEEQVVETGFELEALLEQLPAEAEEDAWRAQIEKLEQRIARLGPINLAAIDEFKELSERKRYLDAQFADLTEALATLENAIHKIDRETRSRFKETFDKVNAKLQEMFPRLFGGGSARLELESDDLLSTGVSLMARPPGKRISSIHLLSGGEKALAAVAMVFAIFELNPAPFCLLDEVDAPLDDTNVVRFCDLLKEMSDRIQFIFITHNKLTMEMAGQLTGVTMHEPGVSRVVAVDVEAAAAMAAM